MEDMVSKPEIGIDNEKEMPLRAFLATLTTLIVGGFCAAITIASYTYSMTPTIWWFVVYVTLAIPGVLLSNYSNNWIFSLIGYGLVILPTGAIVGPYVALFEAESVQRVMFLTTIIAACIGTAGVVYPKSVQHWGGYLLVGLLVVLLADIARIIMRNYFGIDTAPFKFIDYGAALLFCGLIFYDFNQAVRRPLTLDGAVDSAVHLYLDILNLFIRLLSFGKMKS
jgi:FtsH-binding integral membrane protein